MVRKKVLVLTSAYQRWQSDPQYEHDFVVELTRRLSSFFEMSVLAPSDKRAKNEEVLDGVRVFRHAQAPFNVTGLAYGSGIPDNLRKSKALALLVPFFLFFQFVSLLRLVRREQPDVILVHWLVPQGLAAALCKRWFCKGMTIIAIAHGSDILGDRHQWGTRIRLYLAKVALKDMDEVAVVSRAIERIVRELGVKQKIHVYPMGVDSSVFHPAKRDEGLRESLGVTERAVLFVGLLIERKGIRFLIEAVPYVLEKHPQTKFIVMGQGVLRQEMEERVHLLGIEENVRFLGHIGDIALKAAHYASADLFVLPSLEEGFGLVNIEAMSSGLVPIVTDCPAFRDIIDDGKTGFVVAMRDAKALAAKISFLLDCNEQLIELGREARRAVVEKFDWAVVTENYRKLIVAER